MDLTVDHSVTNFVNQFAAAWAPLSTGASQEPTSLWPSHSVTDACDAAICSRMGLLHSQQVNICSYMALKGLHRHNCPTMVCTLGYRGISAPVYGEPPPPPSSLGVCRAAALTNSNSFLLWPQMYMQDNPN